MNDHLAAEGEVRLHRLDLATGESLRLTRATCRDTQWRPWCTDAGRAVLDVASDLGPSEGITVDLLSPAGENDI